jgi:hypothetical protein
MGPCVRRDDTVRADTQIETIVKKIATPTQESKPSALRASISM